jgi:integrase
MAVDAKARSIDGLKARVSRYDESVKGRPGLIVRVWPTGTKTFMHRFQVDGGTFRLSLGEYPHMSLAAALAEYQKQRAQLQRGENPEQAALRQRAAHTEVSDPTVRQLATRYLNEHAKPRKRQRSAREDEVTLERDVLPDWGKLKARQITFADVDNLVSQIKDTKGRGATAPRKMLAVVRKMFSFAVKKRLIPMNPASGIDVPPPPPPRQRSFTDSELRSFIRCLSSSNLLPAFSDALRLQILTGARIGEILGMHAREIDLDAALWTLPQERSKNKLANLVPLTGPALAIVRRRLTEARDGMLFPQRGKGGSLRVDSLAHALARALPRFRDKEGKPLASFTSHDLRRTCETGLAKLGVIREIRDRVLNHKDMSVGAVHYNTHDFLPEKRSALEAWAVRLRHVGGPRKAAVVIPITSAKKSGKRTA